MSLPRTVCILLRAILFGAVAFCIMALLAAGWTLNAQAERYGVDLKGVPVTEIAPEGTHAVVLFFAASDCPISNRYLPEMARLQHEFAGRGVKFWEVYSNPNDTTSVVRQHSVQFGGSADIVLDTEQALVRLAHVTVTPEAAVFVRSGSGLREVYHGRIDDRYLDFGSERPRALRHDLENAIVSALENKTAPRPDGPAVGCAIVMRQP